MAIVTYLRAVTAMLAAVLANRRAVFATVTVQTGICAVSANAAVSTPAGLFTAILADLTADLADYCTVAAMLAAFFTDLCTLGATIPLKANGCAVAAVVTLTAPAL